MLRQTCWGSDGTQTGLARRVPFAERGHGVLRSLAFLAWHPTPPGAEVDRLSGNGRIGRLSDAAGRFRIGPFEEGQQFHVSASLPGSGSASPVDAVAPTAGLVLNLRGPVTIRGEVVDGSTGGPLQEFAVASRADAEWRTAAINDPAGAFEVETDSGRSALRIAAHGYATLLRTINVEAGELDLGMIVLAPARALRGRVLDRDAKGPVSGATVWLLDPDASDFLQHILAEAVPAVAGEDGRFELAGLPPGDVKIQVSAKGFRAQTVIVGADDGDVNIVLDNGATIEGTLVASGAVSPRGGKAFLSNLGTGNGQGLPVDDQGSFVFANLSPGNYRLWARNAKGRPPAGTLPVVPAPLRCLAP